MKKSKIVCYPSERIEFRWVSKEGFGTFQITNGVKGKIYLDNESMSKAHTKRMLCAMVDNAILGDPK
jgi:hypothetical protein